MSYSFSVKAKTKDEVVAIIGEKFDEVIRTQPDHARDKVAAMNTATSFLDILKELPEGHHYEMSVHGSLGWNGNEPGLYTGAGVGVSCRIEKTPE